MNIYLINSLDKVTLEEKIKELDKDNNAEIIYYDLLETPIQRLIEDLNTVNFLSDKKIIIGTNAYFLGADRNKTIEHDIDMLDRYIDNPSPDNYLILTTDNLDKRKKITSKLLEKSELIEEITDIRSLIKKKLDNYNMDNIAINKLIEYCGNDNERIFNELDILILYKEDNNITSEDIDKVVMPMIDDNIFHFIDFILTGNKEYAFKQYHNFMLHGEQVVHLLILLSNKIRLIYQVKVLVNNGKSDKEMSTLLKTHEYPIKLAREAGYKYNEKRLLTILNKLALLDFEIKSGETTGEVEFEELLASI